MNKFLRDNKPALSAMRRTGDAVIATDIFGRVTFVNPSAEQLTGWRSGEALGMPHEKILKLVDPATHTPLESSITLAIRDNKTICLGEYVLLLTKDGTETAVEDSASPIIGTDGKPVGAIIVLQNSSLRRRQEIELVEAEEFNRTVISSSPDCVKIIDMNGNLLSLNENGCRLLEIDDVNAVLNRPWTGFWPDDVRPLAENALVDARQGKTVTFVGFCPTAKGTPKWWEVLVAPVNDSRGQPIRYLSVSRDITERKLIQDALLHTNEELEDFVSNVSHDLRSPIGSIIQLAQLIDMDYSDKLDKHGNELVATIADCGKRMLSLVQSLLDYSRTLGNAPEKIHRVSADKQLATALDNLEGAIKENGAKITSEPLPDLMIGDTQLMQLFQNLIGNAINYRSTQPPRIHISAARSPEDQSMYAFSISDNGKGIDPKFHKFIFLPFKRVDNDNKGSGIGLALCSKIVERAGGRIWVDSEPGKGSTFYFTLPAA